MVVEIVSSRLRWKSKSIMVWDRLDIGGKEDWGVKDICWDFFGLFNWKDNGVIFG